MLIKQAKDKGLNLGAAIEAAATTGSSTADAAQRRGRLLGRHGVEVDARTELEPGEHRPAR